MNSQIKTRDGEAAMWVKSNVVGIQLTVRREKQCWWNEKGWKRWLLLRHPFPLMPTPGPFLRGYLEPEGGDDFLLRWSLRDWHWQPRVLRCDGSEECPHLVGKSSACLMASLWTEGTEEIMAITPWIFHPCVQAHHSSCLDGKKELTTEIHRDLPL